MAITLYYMPGSAACRMVLLTAKALNLKLDLVLLDLMKKEQLKPEFIKINPQHTIPTLVDDGFALWESRAIITYLANKYGSGTNLYPEDPKARAVVDQRLYFDISTLYQRFSEYFYPLLQGAPTDKDKVTRVEDALKVLDTLLEGQKYSAGPNLTIADLALVSTVSTIEATHIDVKKYPNVQRWYETVKTTAPGYKEANQDGLDAFKGFVDNFKK